MPDYAVVIPCHNRFTVVENAIRSVLAQSVQPARIILVDDGSTDNTAALLAEAEKLNPIVQAVLLPRNTGASAARNAGLALVRETWVAFLDSDDRWLPGAAAALLIAAARDNLDVVVGHFCRLWPDGMVDNADCGWDGGDIREALARTGAIGPSWSLVRSATARGIGGFDPTFHNCNDWDFYTRAAADGAKFGRIDDAVALYSCAGEGRLSHDSEIGGINAARVIAHEFFAGVAVG